jgi:hypothetical protein
MAAGWGSFRSSFAALESAIAPAPRQIHAWIATVHRHARLVSPRHLHGLISIVLFSMQSERGRFILFAFREI